MLRDTNITNSNLLIRGFLLTDLSQLNADESNDDRRIENSNSPNSSIDGSYGCTQCSSSFHSRDQLEKHQLTHSPNSSVVSRDSLI